MRKVRVNYLEQSQPRPSLLVADTTPIIYNKLKQLMVKSWGYHEDACSD